MYAYKSIVGKVVSQPEYNEGETTFFIETDNERVCVVRVDDFWQRRDVVFIRIGQTISVSGEMRKSENTIIASHIQIIAHGEITQKEEE